MKSFPAAKAQKFVRLETCLSTRSSAKPAKGSRRIENEVTEIRKDATVPYHQKKQQQGVGAPLHRLASQDLLLRMMKQIGLEDCVPDAKVHKVFEKYNILYVIFPFR